jgi:Tol biopolymer transport system component
MRGGIWLIPALGGTARKVTDFGSHPAWSRDGKWIAFQSSLLDDFGADAMGANPTSTVWVVRTDGTDLRQLTTHGNPNGGHGSPSWSPDGKHIVFVSSLSGLSKGVWVIGADGTGLTLLVAMSFGHYDPVYTPDGNSVVYGAVGAGHDFGLWQVHVSPDTSAAVGPPTEITNSGGTRIKNLAFSSDGKKLIYAAVSLTGSLISLPISKSAEPVGEPVTLTSEVGCREILPSISPDGSRIAFDSCHGRAGISQQIWVMNADGSNLQQLTFPPNTVGFPSWYPDGRRILVSSWNGTEEKVNSVDADTREQKVIMKMDGDYSGPELSPDGRQGAMFFSEHGIINTWVVDMETGQKKQITFDKEMASYPSWSPDGKFIAYQIARGEDNGIFILPSTGGTPTQITPIHGQHWSSSWSPDGDKVIFARPGDDLNWNIWSVSRSTKIEKQLTHYTKRNAFVRYPATSPKGNQIVYEYTETTGNIWMMDFK